MRTRPSRWTAAVVVALGAASCGGGTGDGDAEVEDREAPRMAPAYEAVTFDGDSVALAGLRGEVVLLNVWATWCAPCRREIPELQALHEEHAADGLRVVGVTVDSRSAGDAVRQFVDEFGMTYDIWWDPDQRAVSTFGAVGVPLTILIDRQGRMVWRHLGPFERGDPELLRAVEAALDGEARRTGSASG